MRRLFFSAAWWLLTVFAMLAGFLFMAVSLLLRKTEAWFDRKVPNDEDSTASDC